MKIYKLHYHSRVFRRIIMKFNQKFYHKCLQIQFVSIEKIFQTQKVQDKNEVIKKIVQTSKRNNFSIFQLCEHLPPKYLTVYQ